MDEQHIQQLYDQPYAESYDAKFLMSVIDKLNTEHELSLLRGISTQHGDRTNSEKLSRTRCNKASL